MSDTDIYKKREAMPMGSGKPPKKRQRRRSEKRAFDDHSRKRRSSNSGMRRMLHLFRKKENEKIFWGSLLGVIVITLVLIAVWQFVIFEIVVRNQEMTDSYIEHQRHIPEAAEAAE